MDSTFSLEYLSSQLERRSLPKHIKERIENIIILLGESKINLGKLRKLCELGIPDDIKGLRSLCWKLLIGYLPPEKSKWTKVVQGQKQAYYSFCSDFLKPKLTNDEVKQLEQVENDTTLTHAETAQKQKMLCVSQVQDHPLSRNQGSVWKSFFQDQQQWDEVEKDTIRTRAELSFFVSPTQIPNNYPVQFRTQIIRERQHQQDTQHKHFDVLTRILFVYAKLNPAIRYVQGMNEILAPFYYAFYDDFHPLFLDTAESDAFFCFTMFMADAKESFMRQLDNSTDGIRGKMDKLNALLKITDEELWQHFEDLKLNPQFYSLRWIMLYLTQEFELFDVLRLWDSLLSRTNKNYYLLFLCLGILKVIRDSVIVDDFADVMEAIQRLQAVNVLAVLQSACDLYEKYGVE